RSSYMTATVLRIVGGDRHSPQRKNRERQTVCCGANRLPPELPSPVCETAAALADGETGRSAPVTPAARPGKQLQPPQKRNGTTIPRPSGAPPGAPVRIRLRTKRYHNTRRQAAVNDYLAVPEAKMSLTTPTAPAGRAATPSPSRRRRANQGEW